MKDQDKDYELDLHGANPQSSYSSVKLSKDNAQHFDEIIPFAQRRLTDPIMQLRVVIIETSMGLTPPPGMRFTRHMCV